MEARTNDADGDVRQVRTCALAVSVLDDIDLTLRESGVLIHGPHPVLVGWDDVAETVGGHSPTSAVARRRLSVALRLCRVVAAAGRAAPLALRPAARLLALPLGHAAHPGDDWVRSVQLGQVTTCGVGVVGLLGDPDETVPLPPVVVRAAGADPAAWWPSIVEQAENMGDLAVRRLLRDRVARVDGSSSVIGATDSQTVLRPVGGVDVLSLLTTRALRTHLATEDGSGMRAVAVPMRSRGWYDLARIDPAFVAAAWTATDPWDRGLPRPVLVTPDELALAHDGGRLAQQSLADPAVSPRFERAVRYR